MFMKVALIGSRGIANVDVGAYLPDGTTEIVSGGAKGADAIAREYANKHGLKLTEFLPDYGRFGRGAPIKRNEQIVDYADAVVALWDGKSRGTKYVIDYCAKVGKPCAVHVVV
jgi:hypothetical protein